MSKQTAVEWLYEEITKKSVNDPNHNVLGIFEQAKEMEKSQHEKTYNQRLLSNFQTFEHYYNETYK
jgi:hypothetical protein